MSDWQPILLLILPTAVIGLVALTALNSSRKDSRRLFECMAVSRKLSASAETLIAVQKETIALQERELVALREMVKIYEAHPEVVHTHWMPLPEPPK